MSEKSRYFFSDEKFYNHAENEEKTLSLTGRLVEMLELLYSRADAEDEYEYRQALEIGECFHRYEIKMNDYMSEMQNTFRQAGINARQLLEDSLSEAKRIIEANSIDM